MTVITLFYTIENNSRVYFSLCIQPLYISAFTASQRTWTFVPNPMYNNRSSCHVAIIKKSLPSLWGPPVFGLECQRDNGFCWRGAVCVRRSCCTSALRELVRAVMEYQQWVPAELGIYYSGLKQSGHKFAVAPLSPEWGSSPLLFPSSHRKPHASEMLWSCSPLTTFRPRGLLWGNELLADHFNKIQSWASFAILVTMFRLYNVTSSVKIWNIGLDVKLKLSSDGWFVRGCDTVTDRCAERMERLAEYWFRFSWES